MYFKGIRENPNAPLFRIVETNSDDDLSLENENLPSTSTRPMNPIHTETTTDECEDIAETNNNNLNGNADTNYPQASTSWDDNNRNDGYSSVLSRLRNETNESEVESSYSTEPSSPRKYNSVLKPNDCETSALPSSSKNSASPPKRTEQESMQKKQKCKMKRLKRNYRRQNGDSDTT